MTDINGVGSVIPPSSGVRQKNFDCFEKRYGLRPAIGKDENEKYYVEISRSGEPVLYIKNAFNGRALRLNSSYSPSHEAKVWAIDRMKALRKTDVLVFGFSTGVFIKALLASMRPDTELYVYEPSEALFSYICACDDITDIINNSRVHLFISNSQKNQMTSVIHNDIIVNKPEIFSVTTPFYSSDAAFNHICEEVGTLSVSLRNFKKSRGRNALKCRIHAWTILDKAHLLSDLKERIPDGFVGVIISAGPSLNINVQKLNELKGHAFLLATDRSLSTLKKYDIVPDAAISVDAEKNSEYLEYALELKIPIICSYQLNAYTQDRVTILSEGNLIFFDEISYERELLGDGKGFNSNLDLGGNVAGAAYVVMTLLGAGKVILVGQDLAYLNGKHHADCVEDGMAGLEGSYEVPSVNGGTVKSNEIWIRYRDFYSRQIRQNPDIKVIDATEGGAFIEGTYIMSLREAARLVKNNSIDVAGAFDKLPFCVDEAGMDRVRAKLSSWENELDEIKEMANELKDLFYKLLNMTRTHRMNGSEYDALLQKADKIRKRLPLLEMNSMLEEFWVEDMYSIPQKVLYLRREDEAIDSLSESAAYYENLVEDAGSLLEEFRKSGLIKYNKNLSSWES